MISSTLPELLDDASAWRFAQAGVAAAAGLRTGIRCAAATRLELGDPVRLASIASTARAAASNARGVPEWLPEHEAKELLRAGGIPVVDGRRVTDADDAVLAIGELGGSVALKLSSASVRHKSELGGVQLGLSSAAEARRAFRRLAALAAEYEGAVLAERMAAPGVELLVAVRTDGVVPALVLGLGGIWTELLDDVQVVPLPASAERVERALLSLRGAPMLAGGRGRERVDIGAAARLAARTGELLVERSLELIELNPVRVAARGAVALDATIRRWAPVAEAGVGAAEGRRAWTT
jgi:succinyl-CoA synthetase beta subunit